MERSRIRGLRPNHIFASRRAAANLFFPAGHVHAIALRDEAAENQGRSQSARIHRMKCPYCNFGQDRVVDSRESKEADSIRRRRECERCNRRFTTYERIDEIPYMVVKKDGRRERFDRQKVLSGLLRACEKRPVPASKLEAIVDAAETYLVDAPERERTTSEIGELIMEHLKGLDTVAYIRFASVYRDFKDVREFKEELEGLLGGRSGGKQKK
jgi:transcriptional repressor NrdR